MKDVKALRESVKARSEYFQAQLDRRLEAYQVQLDQRFSAAETAVQAALASAEKAVVKAEIAAEKRFESVNEFRDQLSDQASTFISRNEASTRLEALSEKMETLTGTNGADIAAIELRLTSRLDMITGEHEGSATRRIETRKDNSVYLQIVAVLISIAAILFVAFHGG